MKAALISRSISRANMLHRSLLAVLYLLCVVVPSLSFTPSFELPRSVSRNQGTLSCRKELSKELCSLELPCRSKPWLALASAVTMTTPIQVLAAVEADEVSELPPPFIPVLFGFALIGGVGWLTASLGDVMEEEASLGLQSGARAKKERERSSSSYFKKR